jgi:SAM-dependent methyltransferase
LLDYACGNGIGSRAFLDQVDLIRGVDISANMVDAYNSAAKEDRISEDHMVAIRGDIIASDGENFSARLQEEEFFDFDVIILSMALHHMAYPEALLAKLVERLRSDGVLVIIDWKMEGMPEKIGSETDSIINKIVAKLGYYPEDIQRLLSDAGCSPDSIGFREHTEMSHIPETASNVKGGIYNTFFIGIGRKP